MRIAHIALVAAVIAGAVAYAQSPAQQTFRAGVDYVEIDAVVTDRRGNFVRNLTKSDFQVLEDDSLRILADMTGGFAAVNSNSFSGIFDRIVRDSSTYYLPGFDPANDRRDGRFRRIDVRVDRADITIPQGYRDWRLISVAREEGLQNDIRAVLGNDAAIRAYRDGMRPFPDGTIIARLAWSLDPSEDNNKAFGRVQSFVAGAPKNGVQFMIKDSNTYASTGGWGYVQFNDDGTRADEKVHNTCYSCHRAASARDFVFTNYSR